MNIALQSKLLRVLQEGTFWRVGGSKLIQTDVRVLSNINVPPAQAIKEERLRKDLYFRLGVINVTVPPLRERRDDIPLLSKTFIMACNKKLLKNITKLSTATLELFYSYSWPGNVRELQHAIEYAMNIIPIEKDIITPEYIPDHILDAVGWERRGTHFSEEKPTMESFMQEAGRRFLHNALLENNGNISKTARALGITRQNLQHRMKKFGVHAEENLPQDQ
jgi:arginine utilization regulatory protein